MANRIIAVGDPERAKLIASMLDGDDCFKYSSNRGFVTYSGRYQGVRIELLHRNHL